MLEIMWVSAEKNFYVASKAPPTPPIQVNKGYLRAGYYVSRERNDTLLSSVQSTMKRQNHSSSRRLKSCMIYAIAPSMSCLGE